jgi:hypothetical protein
MQYILKAPEHFPPANIFFVLRKWLHYTLVTIQAKCWKRKTTKYQVRMRFRNSVQGNFCEMTGTAYANYIGP